MQTSDESEDRIEDRNSKLIAIDILLAPGIAMIAKSKTINALLRENKTMADVVLLQRHIREKELDEVIALLGKMFINEKQN
jgi:hypothetical protein